MLRRMVRIAASFIIGCIACSHPDVDAQTRDAGERLVDGRRLEANGDAEGALAAYDAAAREQPQDWRAPMLRAQLLFRRGENARALSDFDRVVVLAPEQEPYLWQRGIAQYYAEAFEACVAQFELHREVNPDDVENAAWHFLCKVKSDGVDAARAALLPVGPDGRPAMPEVYRLFAGELEVEDVLRAAGAGRSGRFYADLYVGLFLEAIGKPDQAAKYLTRASEATVGGYMRDVARVHVRRSRKRPEP